MTLGPRYDANGDGNISFPEMKAQIATGVWQNRGAQIAVALGTSLSSNLLAGSTKSHFSVAVLVGFTVPRFPLLC